jgi:NADPH:quinone reductase
MVEVRRSTVINAPVEEVWAILRDFGAHDRWHPAVASSTVEDSASPGKIGAIRDLRLKDGGRVREQLLSHSDDEHSFSYCILECTLPLLGYIATVSLKPVTDGNRTFWQWHSRFDPPPHRRQELAKLVGDEIYQAGFRAVADLLRAGLITQDPTLAPTRLSPISTAPRNGTTAAQAIVMERHGGPEVLRLQTVQVPPPQAGEVCIRQTAIGVNFIDIYARTGYFDLVHLPGIPGLEAAGIIESVGLGITEFQPGVRVGYACAPPGAYTTLRIMKPDLLIPLPAFLTDELAAASLLKGIAASFLLHEVYPVKPGDTILVHAAAGGVGLLLSQWASALGASVIGTTSTEEKAGRALRAGCAHVINYIERDFAEEIMHLTSGRGVDAVYDAVGRDTFERSLQSLRPCGALISFGQASGDLGAYEIGKLASKSVTLSRPNYGHYTDSRDAVRLHARRLFSAFETNVLRLDPPNIYKLQDAAQAQADLEGRNTIGPVILRP